MPVALFIDTVALKLDQTGVATQPAATKLSIHGFADSAAGATIPDTANDWGWSARGQFPFEHNRCGCLGQEFTRA